MFPVGTAPGAAQTTKLINQLLVGTHLAATAEAFALTDERRRPPRVADQPDRYVPRHRLAEREGELIHLTLLGRACGASSLSFESSLRLVELMKQLNAAQTSLAAIAQLAGASLK